jgi:hypothetical protein
MGSLLHSKVDLLSNGNKAFSQMVVVFEQKPKCYHEKVDVVKDKCALVRIGAFLFQKRNRVIAPVPNGVEMMGCMIAVVEAEPITLYYI